MVPLTPQRKWRAITVATVVLVPACWSTLPGGLALVPFVFIVLAFLSEHPAAPAAVVRAMGLSALVGVVVSAVAGDVASGIVAGVGAGGVVALRSDEEHSWQARALAVGVATGYAFVLAHTAGAVVLLPLPVFPFTAIGIADHLAERRWERATT
jgi:hypothetical protein